MLTIANKWYRATCERNDDGTVVKLWTHCTGDGGGMWKLAKTYLFDEIPFHTVCDHVHDVIITCPPPEIKKVNKRLVSAGALIAQHR